MNTERHLCSTVLTDAAQSSMPEFACNKCPAMIDIFRCNHSQLRNNRMNMTTIPSSLHQCWRRPGFRLRRRWYRQYVRRGRPAALTMLLNLPRRGHYQDAAIPYALAARRNAAWFCHVKINTFEKVQLGDGRHEGTFWRDTDTTISLRGAAFQVNDFTLASGWRSPLHGHFTLANTDDC